MDDTIVYYVATAERNYITCRNELIKQYSLNISVLPHQ